MSYNLRVMKERTTQKHIGIPAEVTAVVRELVAAGLTVLAVIVLVVLL